MHERSVDGTRNWESVNLPDLNSDWLAQAGRIVLEQFAARGMRIPPGNRLSRAVALTVQLNKRLESGPRFTDDDAQLLERAAEAWRTMWEAFFAMHTIVTRPRASEALDNDLLSCFLRGSDLPTEDANSLPRNTQFEVYTAARLIQSGVTVKRNEPDFRMIYHGEEVGVAAKRLTSIQPNKVRARLVEAVEQIEGQSLRGFVALCLNNWVEDLGDDRSPAAIGARFELSLNEALAKLDTLKVKRPSLLGAFVSVDLSRWHMDEGRPRLEWSAMNKTWGFSDVPDDVERFDEFFGPAGNRLESSLRAMSSILSDAPRDNVNNNHP